MGPFFCLSVKWFSVPLPLDPCLRLLFAGVFRYTADMKYERIYLTIHRKKENACSLGREVALRLLSLGRTVVMNQETQSLLQLAGVEKVETCAMPDDADLAVVLGGDGTLLSAVADFAPRGIPMMGINLGTVGFLADVSPINVPEAFSTVFVRDEGHETTLALLTVSHHRQGSYFAEYFSLNDVVIHRPPAAELNRLDAYVNDAWVDSYAGDGVIVATPAGSTAYSLSCGGPIVYPGTRTMLLTPVANHALHSRPLCLPIDSVLSLRVKSTHMDGMLIIDGQKHVSLAPEDSLQITLSRQEAKIVSDRPPRFFDTMREKLRFGPGKADR